MPKKKNNTFEFKAEMKQLLHLIINSLYTNPDVFLRELVSNSSDALNKVRFLQLTQEEIESPDLPLQIKIELDEEKNLFSIEDTGVGMNYDDLNNKLGTVASSGTLEFINQMKKGDKKIDGNMIGQFGVGFYSAFMVTDEITVETKAAQGDGKAWKWISDGQGTYKIDESDRTDRGTKISFKLKEDHKEFSKEYSVKNIIRKYSNFVDYPIYLGEEQINSKGALWHKSKNEVKEEELNEFYKFISNDYENPLDNLHLAMEGRINFKALLFVPSKAKPNFFRADELKSVQLYSNKVFVQEDCKEILPEYLRFMEGVVDSEDLPLNVSREVTQYTPIMNKIKDVLIGKTLGMIEYWAKAEHDKFKTFYKEFGSLFKSGLNSDFANRERITELLRFQTTKSGDEDLISLSEYVERMPDFQKEIYYMTGESLKEMRKNPKLEFFKKKDVEVLLLSDPVDAFVVPGIFNYKEKPFKSIEKSDIQLDGDDADEKNAVKGEELKTILDVFKKIAGEKVEDVVTSKRLVDSPVMLTIGKDGLDPHMERMMKMMDQGNPMPSKRVLEVNASHPLINNLNRLQSDGKTEMVEAIASQLYESSLLLEGNLESPGEFVNRLTELLTQTTTQN